MTTDKPTQYIPADTQEQDAEVVAPAAVSHDTMDRFLKTYERSAKRWEVVVFPAMFAFIILAGYGFFLIYSLTMDVRQMATAIDPHMGQHMTVMAESTIHMADHMAVMSGQVSSMAANLDKMTGNVEHMANKMDGIDTLKPMLVEINQMNGNMRAMTGNMDMMRHDIAVMTNNVSRPMSMMNNMMPW